VTELYETLQQQKACILDIANQYHAANIRVFGSVVRGEDHKDSDIDFLVEFLSRTTLLEQVGLIDALSTALESIELIQSYTEGYDLPEFLTDRKTQKVSQERFLLGHTITNGSPTSFAPLNITVEVLM
jgi:hypothetical protein